MQEPFRASFCKRKRQLILSTSLGSNHSFNSVPSMVILNEFSPIARQIIAELAALPQRSPVPLKNGDTDMCFPDSRSYYSHTKSS